MKNFYLVNTLLVWH